MKPWRLAAAGAIVASFCSTAFGLVNPKFTPIHLVQQSDTILLAKFRPGDKPGQLLGQVVRVLKGKPDQWKGPVTIDLDAAIHREQAEVIAREANDRAGEQFLIFVGELHEDGPGDGQQMCDAYLHMGQNRWIGLYRAKGGGFEMGKIEDFMEGTWGGGDDQLLRCVDYILADPKAYVPVTAEAAWDRHEKIGVVAGSVTAATAVELGGGSPSVLFIACAKGDRLFAWNGKALRDVTADRGLASRSRAFAWGDFNHDGRLDLASWDGESFSLHLQQPDGTFKPEPLDFRRDDCVGLAVVDSGRDGRAGLVVSTSKAPILLTPTPDGKWAATPLAKEVLTSPTTKPERPGACVVADLDDDGLPDVLQPFGNVSLLYRGEAVGRFRPPQFCNVALGQGRARAFLGDWDGDGRLDVGCTAEDRLRIWQNHGGGRFDERLAQSGSICYLVKGNEIAGQTCDLNSDGRQDMLIVYDNMAPQLFFNRGFRALHHAHDPIDLGEQAILPDANEGLQGGCMGDFNGDGGQDLAIVLKNGQLWVFYRKVFPDEPQLVVRVTLPAGGASAGPVKVFADAEHIRLGAWSVSPGSPASLARRTPGPLTVTWQFPGKRPRQAKVQLKDRPLEFVLEP